MVKLHQKLGKPIPSIDPNFKKAAVNKVNFVPASSEVTAATGGDTGAVVQNVGQPAISTNPAILQSATQPEGAASTIVAPKVESMEADIIPPEDDIKPVGNEYIEEIKEDGKIIKFNCKLCECGFNDPNAKEMHMKGRRHRLQYKRKVQPDLVVDLKPTPRQRRIAEAKAQRAAMQADFWNRQRNLTDDTGDEIYWDERRRFDNEFDNMTYNDPPRSGPPFLPWNRGGFPPNSRGGPPFIRAPVPFFGIVPGRARPESFDDRHIVARHAEIYPKEDELQIIQRIVSHTERALKFVSDALTDKNAQSATNGIQKTETQPSAEEMKTENSDEAPKGGDAADNEQKPKEDGRDNQMFSFQKETEGNAIRLLKGVMRVGLLAKGMLFGEPFQYFREIV